MHKAKQPVQNKTKGGADWNFWLNVWCNYMCQFQVRATLIESYNIQNL